MNPELHGCVGAIGRHNDAVERIPFARAYGVRRAKAERQAPIEFDELELIPPRGLHPPWKMPSISVLLVRRYLISDDI